MHFSQLEEDNVCEGNKLGPTNNQELLKNISDRCGIAHYQMTVLYSKKKNKQQQQKKNQPCINTYLVSQQHKIPTHTK